MKLFQTVNGPITISLLLLLTVGIVVISSSSAPLAIQQVSFAFFGLLGYFFIAQSDYRLLTNIIKPAYLIIILLLCLVFILGVETRGAIRWIPLGPLNLQPSELAKPVIILFLADFWVKRKLSGGAILVNFSWFTPVLGLVYKQPDLGTTMTLLVIWLGMLLSADISWKKAAGILTILALLIPLSLVNLAGYQKERLTGFLSPEQDPLGVGYNIIQSTIAVGSGELLGKGLGQGTQSRLQFLPEFRTDFIFAAISEELGFLGATAILLVYLFLISYCLMVASRAVDYFGYLICIGVAIMLFFQTSINIGMNIGLVPITGVTLPLISYGGSSLLATLISLGLVSSVAKVKRPVDVTSMASYN